MRSVRGYTLVELLVGMAIFLFMAAAFGALLRGSVEATTDMKIRAEAQEDLRQGLSKIEEALSHASEVTLSSSAFVEFVCDIDRSRGFDRDADWDGDGVPNFRDADRDNDVLLLLPATAQWTAGYNLKDDDEDGDGRVDMRMRIYLSGSDIMMDTSLNEEAWGTNETVLLSNASSFSMEYFGNKANLLGRSIDLGHDGESGTADPGEADGIITAVEMDMTDPPLGMGDRSGSLDTRDERRYITAIRVGIGEDRNQDGEPDHELETDILPPLLPLRSR